MKAIAVNYNYDTRRSVKPRPYPNAADRRVTLEKVLDFLLALTISASVVTILLFLLALG